MATLTAALLADSLAQFYWNDAQRCLAAEAKNRKMVMMDRKVFRLLDLMELSL